jgi:undecaprenyl-diphosphatase
MVLDRADDVDRVAFRVVAARRHQALDRMLPALAMGGDAAPLWLAIAIAMGMVPGRSRRAAKRAVGALTVAAVVTDLGLKRITRRPRPPLEALLHLPLPAQPRTASFPSGHAAVAAAFATSTWAELGPAAAPLALLAAAIGYSRVYTGAHYPGDVLGGATFGILVGVGYDWTPVVEGAGWLASKVSRTFRDRARAGDPASR